MTLFMGTWKKPLLLNTAKCTASFKRLMISFKVLVLHTGCTICGLSVGSRHIHRLPFGFFTIMKELSHSRALVFASLNLVKMPCDTILSSSFLNCSFRASGTLLGGIVLDNVLQVPNQSCLFQDLCCED